MEKRSSKEYHKYSKKHRFATGSTTQFVSKQERMEGWQSNKPLEHSD